MSPSQIGLIPNLFSSFVGLQGPSQLSFKTWTLTTRHLFLKYCFCMAITGSNRQVVWLFWRPIPKTTFIFRPNCYQKKDKYWSKLNFPVFASLFYSFMPQTNPSNYMKEMWRIFNTGRYISLGPHKTGNGISYIFNQVYFVVNIYRILNIESEKGNLLWSNCEIKSIF